MRFKDRLENFIREALFWAMIIGFIGLLATPFLTLIYIFQLWLSN